jgi:hypothetical protein
MNSCNDLTLRTMLHEHNDVAVFKNKDCPSAQIFFQTQKYHGTLGVTHLVRYFLMLNLTLYQKSPKQDPTHSKWDPLALKHHFL